MPNSSCIQTASCQDGWSGGKAISNILKFDLDMLWPEWSYFPFSDIMASMASMATTTTSPPPYPISQFQMAPLASKNVKLSLMSWICSRCLVFIINIGGLVRIVITHLFLVIFSSAILQNQTWVLTSQY